MDALTRQLHTFLVQLHYQPQTISHQMQHYVEHLVCLLPPDDEEAILHYFGILGHEQLSLGDIARARGLSPEAMIEQIDQNLRRLAVTPEWQMMKETLNP